MNRSRTPVSRESRILQGASRLGIDPYEYRQYVDAGLKYCYLDRAWEPIERFGPHPRTSTGIDTKCRESARKYARERMRARRAGLLP